MKKSDVVLALVRISLGLIFLWAFFDKVFGLGFATSPENSWLAGGSPTTGFLLHATKGPLASFFQSLVSLNPIIDIVFMVGLLLIGIGLTLGITNKLACYSGALMMLLMWLAVLPPEHHPILDDHIVYLLVLVYLAHVKTIWSLQSRWKKTKLVKKFSWLL